MATMQATSPTIQLTAPLILGNEFNWALYGILLVQMYIYARAGTPDTRTVKRIVYGIFILETVQTGIATYDSYEQLAVGWGNYDGLIAPRSQLVLICLPITTGITSSTIQCFYAWRMYIIGKSRVLPAGIVVLALVQGVAAIAQGFLAVFGIQALPVIAIWLGATALCDILISCSMAWLVLSKNRTGFKHTDTMINKLICLVIETGFATAILAIVMLCLLIYLRDNFSYMPPSLLLSKCYCNSMLLLLNNRVSVTYKRKPSVYDSRLPAGDEADASGPGIIHVSLEAFNGDIEFARVLSTKVVRN
ncbi:hypothetical protein A0H81_06432 [Grifola frondosa]|uniref:DUF6534 domain-containing protein n=1 Tax=Grifola frondosa TaxID=5627 RepID=A0A1C7MA16_GRIFR|nr:hypothetical protein A0H81_06432 [Grifola frondosa]